LTVIRSFIAIDLSPEIHTHLGRVTEQLKTRMPGVSVRWVPAKNIHLTIKFLGDVSPSNLEIVKKLLEAETSKYSPFEFSVGGMGAFPSVRRPRVIWIGVEAPAEMKALHRGVEAEAARLGYAAEKRKFSPHLTLGRVSRNARSGDIRQISDVLNDHTVGFLGATRVEAVHLYRSDLKPGGAVYTQLFSAPLGA
jgi:2'-5' RNA ligase